MLHTILHWALHHSTRLHYSAWLWKFSLSSTLFCIFAEPSIWPCFALEPSSSALEMSHLALFSYKSRVTWHWSCGTWLRVFDWDSKIEGILRSCRSLSSHKNIMHVYIMCSASDTQVLAILTVPELSTSSSIGILTLISSDSIIRYMYNRGCQSFL